MFMQKRTKQLWPLTTINGIITPATKLKTSLK